MCTELTVYYTLIIIISLEEEGLHACNHDSMTAIISMLRPNCNRVV